MKNRIHLGLLITTVNLAMTGIILVVCFILAGEASEGSLFAPIKHTILFLCFSVVPLHLLMLITKKLLAKYVHQRLDSEVTDLQKRHYKSKLNQLNLIEGRIMRLTNRNTLSVNPRMSDAISKASVAMLIIVFMGLGFDQVSETYFLMVLCAVSISVAYFAYKASSAAGTWIEELDNKLAEYDPVCIGSYKHLQKTIREEGYRKIDAVLDWLVTERGTVKEALNPEAQAARRDKSRDQDKQNRSGEFVSKFLEKDIPDNDGNQQ